jgi:hypothetical protein
MGRTYCDAVVTAVGTGYECREIADVHVSFQPPGKAVTQMDLCYHHQEVILRGLNRERIPYTVTFYPKD